MSWLVNIIIVLCVTQVFVCRLARKSIIAYALKESLEYEDTNKKIKKMKRVLLGDKVSNRLQIWMVASLLDVNSNKTIKRKIIACVCTL